MGLPHDRGPTAAGAPRETRHGGCTVVLLRWAPASRATAARSAGGWALGEREPQASQVEDLQGQGAVMSREAEDLAHPESGGLAKEVVLYFKCIKESRSEFIDLFIFLAKPL